MFIHPHGAVVHSPLNVMHTLLRPSRVPSARMAAAAMALLAVMAPPAMGQTDPPSCLNFESAADAFGLLGVLGQAPGCGENVVFSFQRATKQHQQHTCGSMLPMCLAAQRQRARALITHRHCRPLVSLSFFVVLCRSLSFVVSHSFSLFLSLSLSFSLSSLSFSLSSLSFISLSFFPFLSFLAVSLSVSLYSFFSLSLSLSLFRSLSFSLSVSLPLSLLSLSLYFLSLSFSVCCLARHYCDTTVMVRSGMLTLCPSFCSRRALSLSLSLSFSLSLSLSLLSKSEIPKFRTFRLR